MNGPAAQGGARAGRSELRMHKRLWPIKRLWDCAWSLFVRRGTLGSAMLVQLSVISDTIRLSLARDEARTLVLMNNTHDGPTGVSVCPDASR